MLIEKINEIISDNKISTEKKLLLFWEQKYINLDEDARSEEFYVLRNLYFKVADLYEDILKKDPSKIDDEVLYRKHMIKQRQIGIRMIAATSGTDLEDEAKTFESQTSGTQAGNRSAANIRNEAMSKRTMRSGGFNPGGASGGSGSYSGESMSLKSFIKYVLLSKYGKKLIIKRLLFAFFLETMKFLTKIYVYGKLSRKAVLDENISSMVSRVAGESVAVKVNKLKTFGMYGYGGYVILSKKIVDIFNNDEIIALSLYIHGANRKAVAKGIALGSIRFIISTSAEVLTAYSATLEIQRTRNALDALSKMISRNFIKSVVLSILLEILNVKLDIHNALQFVKSKGYLRHLMDARKRFPIKAASNIPEVDVETANEAVNLFTKFLEIINFKDSISNNNVSKPISFMNKVSSIFKRS